jgi:hypothetical protein
MLIDGFLPEGVTRLAVDSIFMMPQLGVLTQVQPQAATEVFNKDCLIHLGCCIAPVGETKKPGSILDYEITLPDGKVESGTLEFGQMKLIKLGLDERGLPLKAKAKLNPHKGFDIGRGRGNDVESEVSGGVAGIILDGRGRPLTLSEDKKVRIGKLKEWMTELEIYPKGALDR